MKTIATYKSKGVYNNKTNKIEYASVITKVESSKWVDTIVEIDGKKTKSMMLYPTIINDMVEDYFIVFRINKNKYIVHNSMCNYNNYPHRNDFKTLKNALEFIELLRNIKY